MPVETVNPLITSITSNEINLPVKRPAIRDKTFFLVSLLSKKAKTAARKAAPENIKEVIYLF